MTKQPPVTKQHLDLGHQPFSRTTSQGKMRSSTMQHLDQGKRTSLPYRTISLAT
jgi:hypothetical protein